ncbi:MAG: hypothetical protein NT077_00405 [Candidatus Taylorbacteria bacterium]|nr:hypothetical protein [Candidatus Taylorbacteria bacterium]
MQLKKFSKGQGAMEYLSTYGWAILVVVLVGLVLYQAGVFNTQTTTTFSGWKQLQPLSPTVNYFGQTGQFEAGYTNAAGVDILLRNITVVESIAGSICTGPVQTTIADSTGNTTVKPGGLFKITATGCPIKSVNEGFDMNITIEYTALLSEHYTNHTEIGRIAGIVLE